MRAAIPNPKVVLWKNRTFSYAAYWLYISESNKSPVFASGGQIRPILGLPSFRFGIAAMRGGILFGEGV
jgi:hypothetical protein